ncbi:unnamed protein product, partial [Gulo gulo]
GGALWTSCLPHHSPLLLVGEDTVVADTGVCQSLEIVFAPAEHWGPEPLVRHHFLI